MALKGYTTKAAIENYMQVDIDGSFDTQVDEWIEAAELIIDQETNRNFIADEGAASDKVFDGDGTDELVIPPTNDVDAVKLDPDGTALETDQYALYPANQTIKTKIKLRYQVFPEGLQNIVITANWGTQGVPKDIMFAATVIVAGILRHAWEDPNEVQSMTIGRYTVSYKTRQQQDDLTSVQEILDRNKRYHF